MLLSTSEQVEHYHSAGLWQDERLDQIFARHVEQRPEELAFVDDQTLAEVTGRQPQCLPFGRAWLRVLGACSFLSGIGVKPDTVVAMLLPPSVDAALISLVASRMGLILAPMSLTLGEADLRERLEQVGAKAVICCSHYEDMNIAEQVRNVAAEMFSIRFVFCVGGDVPDGLIDFAPMLEDEETALAEDFAAEQVERSADAAIVLHWTSATSRESVPLARSHNQILSAARHTSEQTSIKADECVMIAHHLSGLVGYAAGMIAAMDIGARIQFHHISTPLILAQSIEEFAIQHISLPESFWELLHQCLSANAREQLVSISLVWNRVHPNRELFRLNETAARLLDLTNFGELALHSQIRREPGHVGAIKLGETPSKLEGNPAWFETYLFGMEQAREQFDDGILGGELCLRGAMVPNQAFPVAGASEGDALPANSDGFVHTEIGCRVTEQDGDQMSFTPLGNLSDILVFGGLSERGADLDALYRDCAGVVDAAAFVMTCQDSGQSELLVALVVEDQETGRERFFASLQSKKVSVTKIPHDVIFVEAIPRQTNGTIQRGSLIEAAMAKAVA